MACGGPLLAVQWGRSGGRRRQDELFALWGGAPTTTLLRFATGGSAVAVAERHRVVEPSTGMSLPSASEEAADPALADAQYEEAVKKLRAKTRDEREFRLLLKENIGYGFRRNLWGRKRYGIAVALVVILASAALLIADALGNELVPWPSAAVGGAFALAALAVWITVVTTEWVHESAKAYAEQLFEAAIRLAPDR